MAKRGAPIGNKNAATGATIRDAINYELAALGRQIKEQTGEDGAALKVGMRALVKPHIDKAVEGDHAAFKEVVDRVDGKAAQSVSLDGELTTIVNGTVRFADE